MRSTILRLHTRLATVPGELADRFTNRVEAVPTQGEHGAQAAEYAMLGGVSAAACAGLLYWLKNRGGDLIIEAVVDAIMRMVTSWF